MKFIFYFSIINFLSFNSVHSTSTTFDQNLIFNDNVNFFQSNEKVAFYNIQSIIMTGSIGFLGKELYNNGFLSPFGFIPKNYYNLSPLVYMEPIRKARVSKTNIYCKKNSNKNVIERYGHSEISTLNFNICQTVNLKNNVNQLIHKYEKK